jgi:hypothetical protein
MAVGNIEKHISAWTLHRACAGKAIMDPICIATDMQPCIFNQHKMWNKTLKQ